MHQLAYTVCVGNKEKKKKKTASRELVLLRSRGDFLAFRRANAIVDRKLRLPQCATYNEYILPDFIIEQNVVGLGCICSRFGC